MRALGTTLLLLSACSEEPTSTPKEVPFPLGDPEVALFAVSPNNTPRQGWAILLISNGDMRCAELRALELDLGISSHLDGEEGLVFGMEYRQRSGIPEPGDPWGGLWMAHQGVGDATRDLWASAVADGYVTTMTGNRYYNSAAWLDLERSEGTVSARYHTALWAGAVQARDCGAWAGEEEEEDDRDTDERDTGRETDTDDLDVDTAADIHTGPTRFESATYNCDSGAWWFDVATTGWAGEVNLFISQTGVDPSVRWYELGHGFPPTESFEFATNSDTRGYYDPRGYWDNPYLELGIVQTPQDVVIDATSLFQCNNDRIATLTWALEVDDQSGSSLGCFAWGEDITSQDQYNFQACQAI